MIAVDPSLRSIVLLGALGCDGIAAGERSGDLDAAIADAERAVRASPPPESAEVRSMYRRVGLDPTKTRPSSEALLRRVRRGEALPRINALVDICNWCSLELQVPYGLYDRGRLSGPIELRLGRDGEEYAGIRKDVVHLAGRMTLADASGPFGNPSSDSARTAVRPETTAVLVAVFAPRALGERWLTAALDRTAERIARFAGGREVERAIV